jgi:hypothetical protein
MKTKKTVTLPWAVYDAAETLICEFFKWGEECEYERRLKFYRSEGDAFAEEADALEAAEKCWNDGRLW